MTEELESFGNMPDPRMRIELPLAQEGIEAGFPAPNGGYIDGGLDVNEFLVHNPRSTYLYCVHGESMRDAGIMQGDYVLVDSSLEVEDGDIVVASVDGEDFGADPMEAVAWQAELERRAWALTGSCRAPGS